MRMREPHAATPKPTGPHPHWIEHLQLSETAWSDFCAFIKTLDRETLTKYDFGKTYEDYLNCQGERRQLKEFCLRCGLNLDVMRKEPTT